MLPLGTHIANPAILRRLLTEVTQEHTAATTSAVSLRILQHRLDALLIMTPSFLIDRMRQDHFLLVNTSATEGDARQVLTRYERNQLLFAEPKEYLVDVVG